MAPEPNPYITIGKDTYHISPDPHASRLPPSLLPKLRRLKGEFVLATAVEWTPSIFTPADLDSACKSFGSDDVWTSEFLSRKLSNERIINENQWT